MGLPKQRTIGQEALILHSECVRLVTSDKEIAQPGQSIWELTVLNTLEMSNDLS